MELMNPKITIQNAQGPSWLVRMEHQMPEGQYLDVQMQVPKDAALTLGGLQQRLLGQLKLQVERLERRLTTEATPTGS